MASKKLSIKGLFSSPKSKGGSAVFYVDAKSQPQLLEIRSNPRTYEDIPSTSQSPSKSLHLNAPYTEKLEFQKPSQHRNKEAPQPYKTNTANDKPKSTGSQNKALPEPKTQSSIHPMQNTKESDIEQSLQTETQNFSNLSLNSNTYSADLLSRQGDNMFSMPFLQSHNDSTLSSMFLDQTVPLPFDVNSDSSTKHWNMITKHLKNLALSCQNNNSENMARLLASTISNYRSDCERRSNFQMLNRPELASLLGNTIPFIVNQALQLKHLLHEPIPILTSQETKTIYLTRQLCCSLLANAFFCTFPEHEISEMPDFNFFRLYNDTQSQRCEVKAQKIKCLLNYFDQMNKLELNTSFQNQIISFERRCVRNTTNWTKQGKPLCKVEVEISKKIEEAQNMLQVDFANKTVGGGVLNDGSVMEEIRFCISPELLVSRLFTQTLSNDEVLVITGTEIFSEYTGYSTSFAYTNPVKRNWDLLKTDNLGRTYTQVVAMDALSFKRNEESKQFQQWCVDRELHKGNVAFMHGPATPTPVATGNWGCGAFNGNPELKFLIQWLAASQNDRPSIVYHTVGNAQQAQEIKIISAIIIEKGMTISDLYKIIMRYSSEAAYRNMSLFDFVRSQMKNRKGSAR